MAGKQLTMVTTPERPSTRPPPEVPTIRSAPSFESPSDVLYANELMRGRLWVAISVIFGWCGVGAALVIDSPGAGARLLLAAGSGVVLIASVVGLVVLQRDNRYSAGMAALYGYACLLGAQPAYYFFGWFSPIVALVALGAVIFAMGHSTRAVVALCAVVVATHASLGAATIAGVIPDRGVAMVRLDSGALEVLCLAFCEGGFVLAFVIGRQLRDHAHFGIERYGEVVRESTRRETLLQEAAEELRRARNVGVRGRFTGLMMGPFRLGVVLGRGGMGEVYDAEHEVSGLPAAVKVITAGNLTDRAVRRFEREIELAGSVASPHIVRVLGHSLPGDEVLYLAMERLSGSSLADELRSLRRPSLAYVLAMLRQVGLGIGAAHEVGVVHRDLSIHNIFHHKGDGADLWKVLDFGVSTFIGHQGTLTGGGVVGTPSYMSPEQALGETVDHRSDLFTLGCVAYRTLTGQAAFSGNAVADVLYQVVHTMPARPSTLTRLPPEIDLVLAVALAKHRDDRFETANEQVKAIAAACSGHIDPSVAHRGRALLTALPWADAIG